MMLKASMLITLVYSVSCRLEYQSRIPNGQEVPNPCGTPSVWSAVGHFDPNRHTLLKNSFANDFRANGHVWSRTLCNMDSDQDGKTNGQELGDPSCVWDAMIPLPPAGKATSHPGICEPVGSAQCAWQNFACDCLDRCTGIVGFP